MLLEPIEKYLKSSELRALTRRTREHYGVALSHLNSFLNSKGCIELSEAAQAQMMHGFCDYLREKRKTGATIQQYITITKMLMRWNRVPIDFTYRIPSEDKKRKQLKDADRWFNEKEIQLCREYSFPSINDPKIMIRNQLMISLLIETGARIDEIANIKGKDFDLENNTVFLGISKTQVRPVFYSTETSKLVHDLHDLICVLFKSDWEYRIFPTTVFCKEIVTDMLNELGLKRQNDGRGPHTFRHYVATYLYYVGNMDLNDLSIFLGDKPETIRNNYLHPTPEMLRNRVKGAYGWKN